MRKCLLALFAGLLFLSTIPVYADDGLIDMNTESSDSSYVRDDGSVASGSSEDNSVVSVSTDVGGNPDKIIENDSVEQNETNNSVLQYSISVPDGFDLLNAGDAELYVFNKDTSVMTKMILPEKNNYQAVGYFPAGKHYLVSGMVFSNTDIQSPFTMPDPDFELSPDQPFVFTSKPADDGIEKSIEIQKQVAAMQEQVKADKERLISEGVLSDSGTNLKLHQEPVSSSDFDYQPVEADSTDIETDSNNVRPTWENTLIVAGIGVCFVLIFFLVWKKKKK